ncbi:hypothetical protein C2R22_24415 (plasmid) [Salinigranum rubrum]|uniref:Uncharacterized protein n=1 Tax=Salinigranum rubrum TaxID=755307 RepID=A0A2I8VRZ2_9EURY|nr:hypothetical protein [Salinigranum rubrum]AUV84677.1 hypothetical protein C2R22_24415 [Salinigranum rubrum]
MTSKGPGVITPRVVDGRVLCHVQHEDVSVLIAANEDTTTHRLTEVATEAANAAVTYGKLFSAESRLGLDAGSVATDGGRADD